MEKQKRIKERKFNNMLNKAKPYIRLVGIYVNIFLLICFFMWLLIKAYEVPQITNGSYSKDNYQEIIKDLKKNAVKHTEIEPLVVVKEKKVIVKVKTLKDRTERNLNKEKREQEKIHIAMQNGVQDFDIDKLAYAVAMQETKNCKLGYGKTHNNCFGIKHGNTAPCPGVPKMAMCKFKTKEDSYKAFKIIWSKWYKGLPNYEMAKRWSGDDRAGIWRNNVLHFYNK